MIKCWHCKGKHHTADQVRDCSRPVKPPEPGRYAVYLPDPGELGGEKLRFFVMPESGPFVEQAGPDYYPVRWQARLAIFREIQKDPKEAMTLYGKKLGHCGKCGTELTKKISRERGFGPKCWERV